MLLDIDDCINYWYSPLVNYQKYRFPASKNIASPLWPSLAKAYRESSIQALGEASVCSTNESSAYEKLQGGLSFLDEHSSSLLMPCDLFWFHLFWGELSIRKGQSKESEGMTSGWPLEENKLFNIIQTWGRKSRWYFPRDLWSKREYLRLIF